jgi:hypothetical protein
VQKGKALTRIARIFTNFLTVPFSRISHGSRLNDFSLAWRSVRAGWWVIHGTTKNGFSTANHANHANKNEGRNPKAGELGRELRELARIGKTGFTTINLDLGRFIGIFGKRY